MKIASQSELLVACLVGLFAFALAGTISLVSMPAPSIHDEFSYLLAADTFAQGRLTNPTHEMWEHFETFHVIHQPSYASKYPPGQGICLAIGQKVGHPIVGAWLATALAATAVTWMLGGWVPCKWTAIGGCLFATHAAIQFEWGQSYWGGGIATAAGAFLFGGFARMCRRPKAASAIAMAIGAVTLAYSRPFEGLVACCCVGFAMTAHCVMNSNQLLGYAKAMLPAALLVATGMIWLACYNQSVTKDPFRMPYRVHESQYGCVPLFLWESPNLEINFRHDTLRRLQHEWAMNLYLSQRTIHGYCEIKFRQTLETLRFYLFPAFLLPLIAAPKLILSKRMRFVSLTIATGFLISLFTTWNYPHYFAPFAPLLFLFVVQGLRYLRTLRRREHDAIGSFALPMVVVAQILVFSIFFWRNASNARTEWHWHRARLVSELERMPGTHLVMVEYEVSHDFHNEWVYNAADIDSAKVVWAREMGAEKDARLHSYFHDRRVWKLLADEIPPRLQEAEHDFSGSLNGRDQQKPRLSTE